MSRPSKSEQMKSLDEEDKKRMVELIGEGYSASVASSMILDEKKKRKSA